MTQQNWLHAIKLLTFIREFPGSARLASIITSGSCGLLQCCLRNTGQHFNYFTVILSLIIPSSLFTTYLAVWPYSFDILTSAAERGSASLVSMLPKHPESLRL
jgi:hypothetical protein